MQAASAWVVITHRFLQPLLNQLRFEVFEPFRLNKFYILWASRVRLRWSPYEIRVQVSKQSHERRPPWDGIQPSIQSAMSGFTTQLPSFVETSNDHKWACHCAMAYSLFPDFHNVVSPNCI